MLTNLPLTDQQRQTALYVLQRHPRFEARTVFEAMKNDGLRVSLATLYRTLAKLVTAGLLRRLEDSTYTHDLGT